MSCRFVPAWWRDAASKRGFVMEKIKRLNKKEKVILLCLLAGLSAAAYPYSSYAAESMPPSGSMEFTLPGVTVEAKRPEWEDKLSPGTVTVIKPEDYKGEQKTLPDLLKEVPGVHVREVNGKGQYTTVTVRGSTAAQVGVFVDGVMTNLGGDSAVDISTIPVKNVERIEVYRGYIPARFGGTFIGGVINVVTKKPKKVGASAEIGKTSLGGDSISAEVTAPLGSGSLLIGANYEDSDGDFRYKNYAAPRTISKWEQNVASASAALDLYQYNAANIDIIVDNKRASLTESQIQNFKSNPDAWKAYYSNTDSTNPSDSLKANIINTKEESQMQSLEKPSSVNDLSPVYDQILNEHESDYKSIYKSIFGQASNPTNEELKSLVYKDWKGELTGVGGVVTKGIPDPDFPDDVDNSHYVEGYKQKVLDEYKKDVLSGDAEKFAEDYLNTISLDPDKDPQYAAKKKLLDYYKHRLKYAKDNTRHRKYNDYKNTSFLAKWQNDNWMVKLSRNTIDRHLPDTTWGDSANDAMESMLTDIDDIYYAESRHQKITNTEELVENRHQNGNLEWGWRADYLDSNKRYKTQKKLFWTPDIGSTNRNFRWNNTPLREWSQYKSNKYNIQLDGSYKLSERQMLDFQTNYSHERLKVDGSLMHQVLTGSIGNLLGCMRNRYDQNIFNFQLQDSITLDKSGSLVLTPAIRYNQSEIIGYSDGSRFTEDSKTHFHWIHPKDSQTNGKWTWQLALKKRFNDHFTLRTTGGTYYRLLNMYEIAGDGAGILPAPRDDSVSVFPLPEEGKQFDFSFLFNGKILGADNNTTITYFWRNSDNMLQLFRAGLDYWSYYNDNRGKAHGWEFQTNFQWKKFDLDIKATQTLMHVQRRNSTVGYGYQDIHPTFQPEWESNVRFTYHPNTKWSFFTEMHYTDSYFTHYGTDERGALENYLAGKPVSGLTVYNAGIKWQPKKSMQFAVGCNDIFDKGPKQKVRSDTYGYDSGYISADFPLQGRTYYATFKYIF